jgi:4'-phosphopantetheinyl transferase
VTNDSLPDHTDQNTVDIYYARFQEQLPDEQWSDYMSYLPKKMQEQNQRYRRWQDRHAHLFGKLLLCLSLQSYGYDRTVLSQLLYNKQNRPFIAGETDFNISHSGEFVICAVARKVRLGIDIETVNPIDFSDFDRVMNEDQWKAIQNSSAPLSTFFEYWTIKESLIKADGRGLSIPLTDLIWEDMKIVYDNQCWYIQPIAIDEKYPCHLATDQPQISITKTMIDFADGRVIDQLSV